MHEIIREKMYPKEGGEERGEREKIHKADLDSIQFAKRACSTLRLASEMRDARV